MIRQLWLQHLNFVAAVNVAKIAPELSVLLVLFQIFWVLLVIFICHHGCGNKSLHICWAISIVRFFELLIVTFY
jgi:hypothetical protein